jgi:DNA gyrase subunit B
VYIAVPPLYRVKLGGREQYMEKQSQFEDLLVRERVKDMTVTDGSGEQFVFTEARYGRFTRALAEYEGWLGRLRADHGHPAADFVVVHRLIELTAETPGDVASTLGSLEPNGYEISVLEHDDSGFRAKVVEAATSAAAFVTVPAELLSSPVYANLKRAYAKIVAIVGRPPFRLALGKKTRVATTFDALREAALDMAKEGIQVSRFKGLGEMNPEELRDTTMDPAKRMLIRVEVEDATLADEIFSKLMGDQVEPRRLFIEENAKDVRFLDV